MGRPLRTFWLDGHVLPPAFDDHGQPELCISAQLGAVFEDSMGAAPFIINFKSVWLLLLSAVVDVELVIYNRFACGRSCISSMGNESTAGFAISGRVDG